MEEIRKMKDLQETEANWVGFAKKTRFSIEDIEKNVAKLQEVQL